MAIQEITRLFDFPYYQLETHHTIKAFNTKIKDEWIATSSQEYINKANAISRALLRLGVRPNDKIAVISSTNRTEWNIMDIGIQQIGAQNIPMYPTISEREYEYIFNHAEVKLCFLSDNDLFRKANAIRKNVPSLQEIYSFDSIEGCKNWQELLELGKDESNQTEVENLKNSIKPSDLATIIYTSGTTGVPKGVMLSHHNIVSNILSATEFLPNFNPNSKVLSFLPVCHILERCAIYVYQYLGLNVYYGEGIDKIGENLKEVKPELITVVPRLIEKVYDKIYTKGSELSGIKKKLFYWAIGLGQQYDINGHHSIWHKFQLNIARKLIFVKWKDALGGKLNYMICGSAALQPKLIKIFGAAGIKIIEGYGLTESPIVSANNYKNKKVKLGTVGISLNCVNVTIGSDGEILVQGSNVMMGYYKDEVKTNEVLKNGIFHTGDKGEIDAQGFVKITGRKKEIFKTSGGKYIAPATIEGFLKESRFIEQVMVVGENEKMPAAIIQPQFEFLIEWAKRKKIKADGNIKSIITHKKVIKRIQKEIDTVNEKLGDWEKIKAFELTSEIWSVENDLLTPTLKMKREIIKQSYIHLYAKIYKN